MLFGYPCLEYSLCKNKSMRLLNLYLILKNLHVHRANRSMLFRPFALELKPVVQSIVSLTTSLRHELVKYMWTTLSNMLLFFVEKM